MGRENYYKPGSHYVLCDRTGFVNRAGRTRKEWNGLIVRDRSFEPRQPQDFVRGVRDEQAVPDARPRPPNSFDGPADSTLSAAAYVGARYVLVNSPFPYQVGNRVGIMLDFDKGTMFFCVVVQPGTIVGGDYNVDYNDDYSHVGGPGIAGSAGFSDGFSSGFAVSGAGAMWIAPRLPGFASSGNWVVNLSVPEITAASYGASSGG